MKKLTILLGVTVILSGCAVGPSTGNCKNPPITNINITFVKNSEIKVVPPNANSRRGNVLRFKLTGDSSKTVNITGKTGDDSWINGTGSGGDFVLVCVDPNQAYDTYEYKVDIPTVGFLDPEVTVRR